MSGYVCNACGIRTVRCPCGAQLLQGGFNRAAHGTEDMPFFAEAHFAFGGMHVHIDHFGVQFDEQQHLRILAPQHSAGIGIAHGTHEQFVGNRSAVDVKQHLVRPRLRLAGVAAQSAYLHVGYCTVVGAAAQRRYFHH